MVKWKKIWENQEAVSEIIGEVLMVTVAVMAFAILSATIFSLQTPSSSPHTDTGGWVAGDTVNLQHRGGDNLKIENMEFILDLNGTKKTVNSTTLGTLLGDSYWQLGDTITINTSDLWGIVLDENDTIRAIIVYDRAILTSGTLAGAGGSTPSGPTPTPTPTPPPGPTPEAIYTDDWGAGWTITTSAQVTYVQNTTVQRTGLNSMYIDIYGNNKWIRCNKIFNITGYTTLEFYINGESGGESFTISKNGGSPVFMTSYITGGAVDNDLGTWQRVSVPLADLGSMSVNINYIEFKENNKPKFFIDDFYIT